MSTDKDNKPTQRARAPKKGEPGYRDYMRKKLFNKLVKAIQANQQTVFTCQDAFITAKINKSTFYDYFDVDSHEMHALKELLDVNKFGIVKNAVNGLMNKKETAAYIAVIKMFGSDEQRAALNQQDVRLTGSGQDGSIKIQPLEPLKVIKRGEK